MGPPSPPGDGGFRMPGPAIGTGGFRGDEHEQTQSLRRPGGGAVGGGCCRPGHGPGPRLGPRRHGSARSAPSWLGRSSGPRLGSASGSWLAPPRLAWLPASGPRLAPASLGLMLPPGPLLAWRGEGQIFPAGGRRVCAGLPRRLEATECRQARTRPPLTRPETPLKAPSTSSATSRRRGSTGPGNASRPGGTTTKPKRS